MKKHDLQLTQTPIDSLIPYALNSRTHSSKQVAQIAASIKEFGFTNPVLIDEQNGIIAGHGRVLAAKTLGLKMIPTIMLSGLSEVQKKAYVIADNKIALNSGWNIETLKLEFGTLRENNFDLELTGFTLEEIADLNIDLNNPDDIDLTSQYTKKITTPIYEIKGDKPSLAELYQTAHADHLLNEIEASNQPEEIKVFLRHAAARHVRFNYENIAEYYAHASPDLKALMEQSALVIVDYNAAIENGYITLSKAIMELSNE